MSERFSKVVKKLSGHEAIPIDSSNEKDRSLVDEIKKGARNLISRIQRTGIRYQASRVNEVGRRIESEFVDALNGQTTLLARYLGKAGYPNIEVKDKYGRFSYIDSKTTSKKLGKSNMRAFYISSGNKIEKDARHLIISWKVKEVQPNFWEPTKWKLSEATNIDLNLKKEFNAAPKEFLNEKYIL